MIPALWKKLETLPEVFVVVYRGSNVFIEDPDVVDPAPYLEGDQRESVVIAFTSLECANLYANTLAEIHEEMRPSELGVRSMPLKELFALIEELNEMSSREYDAPVRIDVVEQLSENTILSDVIHSPFATKH